MSYGSYNVPIAVNEPVKQYEPGSSERTELLAQYKKMYSKKTKIISDFFSSSVFKST